MHVFISYLWFLIVIKSLCGLYYNNNSVFLNFGKHVEGDIVRFLFGSSITLKMFKRFLTFIVAIAVALGVVSAYPEGARSMELMMPMRDGVKLHTQIYFPRKADGKKFPAVIDRSPYGYGDLEWITDIFLPFGFVAIGQDMRGTEKSEGNFTMWIADANDSQDLGDWILKQDWSNGQVFTFGASADGIGSFQTPRNNPSWLAGQYVAWSPAKMYDILFPYGTYKQETAEEWLMGLTMPNPDVVYENIELVHENEMHSDFWNQIDIGPSVYANIRAPSGFWGGWYDLFQVGTLEAYNGYNTMSDPSVRFTSKITVDPLGHCLEGAQYFPQNAVEGRTGLVLGQLFETYGIHSVIRDRAVKNVTFYVMSSNDEAGLAAGQYWTSMTSWPTPNMVDYYLHADHSASRIPPVPSEDSSTAYVHDPTNPIPTLGGCNLPDDIGGSIPCGPWDQTPLDGRSDILQFQTEVFSDEVALTGPLMAHLFVSSSAVDTDFMVKIMDVYPTTAEGNPGPVRLIQDNAIRMRWRENTMTPVYMELGKVYEVEINVWNTSYVVAPGHALRFSVASSNFPRFSVNPNNGLLLADSKYPGRNISAKNTLHHSTRYPSHFSLPVVHKRTQLPKVEVLKDTLLAYPQITPEMMKAFDEGWQRSLSQAGEKRRQQRKIVMNSASHPKKNLP